MSVYVVFYSENKELLLGKKGKVSRWWGKTEKGCNIFNNPNQHVLIGGHCKPDFILASAVKEIREELGLNLTKEELKYKNRVISKVKLSFKKFEGYSGLYIKVKDLKSIMNTFNLIFEEDTFYHNCGKHSSKNRSDDEIHSLKIVSKEEAIRLFKKENGFGRLATEWFSNIVEKV